MPYGIAEEHGGDSPGNVAKMERCVAKVMADGHTKSSAVAICKSSLFGSRKKA